MSFLGGYHGDTLAAMSVCDPEEGMHRRLRGLLPEQILVALPVDDETTSAFEHAMRTHAASLAAVLVEPLVQGAGGMLFHAPEVLRRLRAACDRHGGDTDL